MVSVRFTKRIENPSSSTVLPKTDTLIQANSRTCFKTQHFLVAYLSSGSIFGGTVAEVDDEKLIHLVTCTEKGLLNYVRKLDSIKSNFYRRPFYTEFSYPRTE